MFVSFNEFTINMEVTEWRVPGGEKIMFKWLEKLTISSSLENCQTLFPLWNQFVPMEVVLGVHV